MPRPPRIADPPTTTAAITFSSIPNPALLGIWLKRTELRSAAQPVSAPADVNTQNVTRAASIPARRAAFSLDPTAYTARPAAKLRNPQAAPPNRTAAIPAVTT